MGMTEQHVEEPSRQGSVSYVKVTREHSESEWGPSGSSESPWHNTQFLPVLFAE